VKWRFVKNKLLLANTIASEGSVCWRGISSSRTLANLISFEGFILFL
jgi:hypothetical protein